MTGKMTNVNSGKAATQSGNVPGKVDNCKSGSSMKGGEKK